MCASLLQRRAITAVAFQLSSTSTIRIPTLSSRSIVTSSTSLYVEGGVGGRVAASVTDKDLLSKTTTDNNTNSSPPKVALDTNPPKGTRDFYPPDMRLRTWLFSQWRIVASLYGFSEYDAPVLESESLYTRKAGEEVTQQLYNFVDKGDRNVALRPEMTPSLARMVMAKKGGLPLPLKWFSIPQCWRYERMTRGRRREHYQWNMDIWGVDGIEAEAELLSAMVMFFKRVGLTSEDVGIKVNSRGVIGEVLKELGVPEEKFAATCVLVDKLEKVPLDAIQGELEELGLEKSTIEKLTSVLTNTSIESISAVLPPGSDAVKQLSQLFKLCEAYGIADWILFDASVVRGLAYYTGIVFEAFDRKGVLRAIAGGGRYDKLLETFGGEPTPAAGFGFGDAVIVELLKERDVLPSFEGSGFDTVVFAMSEDLFGVAVQVASTLRQNGQSVDLILENKKPKWVFKHASRNEAKYCVIVAGDEYKNGEVSVKDLALGEQMSVKIDALDSWAKEVAER
ncbi:histidyl-trna synthetase [Thalassiosira pseudonana CCMP1335]|uniref:histidine--tRNA ligase n=1 Tax=Thalassiosira pseudonana TaxID=35128 RepID=B8C1W7_THAPS|nr:histidyl-trna synthetase [Thalassiosira pseudonana CCMP1335]EED91838.1 histidyl-trna synthetase [Thalassiosira pseudonana CCMP1335]